MYYMYLCFQVEEAKQELKDVVEFLRNPERFKRLGGKMPTGESKYSTVLNALYFSVLLCYYQFGAITC